mmetsp:Transcript_11780/g.37492  ORF Transcript_11780/g.37492 Transcript_11780/m.37492 type:complete len:319 (-) Transcript_11780:237-1193(-)
MARDEDASVRASIGYTSAPSSDLARNGVVVGAANFPLNMSTFRAQHGSVPQDQVAEGTTWENELVPVECEVVDARQEARCLETDGFELVSGLSGRIAPAAKFEIEAYLRSVERVAIDLTGASRAVAYCYAARAPKRPSLGTADTRASYAVYAHTDQAHLSWAPRLAQLANDWKTYGPPGIDTVTADHAAHASRYAVLSAWRYLGPEQKCRSSHLALLDPASVRRDDVLHFEIRTPDATFGSNYRLEKNSSSHHAWRYFPNVDRDDDLLFFTVFDSNPTFANADASPMPTIFHSAFKDPRRPDAPDRESIDVRVLLVWD